MSTPIFGMRIRPSSTTGSRPPSVGGAIGWVVCLASVVEVVDVELVEVDVDVEVVVDVVGEVVVDVAVEVVVVVGSVVLVLVVELVLVLVEVAAVVAACAVLSSSEPPQLDETAHATIKASVVARMRPGAIPRLIVSIMSGNHRPTRSIA
jgi:hypothetical protein